MNAVTKLVIVRSVVGSRPLKIVGQKMNGFVVLSLELVKNAIKVLHNRFVMRFLHVKSVNKNPLSKFVIPILEDKESVEMLRVVVSVIELVVDVSVKIDQDIRFAET
jgi:hypothetical protein